MTIAVNMPSPAVTAMQADWSLITALLGGTRAMRAAGQTYLPKRPLETDRDYQDRLNMTTLFPALSETVGAMTGRVFARPLITNDDVPEWVKTEVLPDVDRQGCNLHVFAREWFRSGLSNGLAHVLIDSPPAPGVRTKADQWRAGIRPYAILIKPQRVLGWRTDAQGKLTQARIAFTREAADGEFGTQDVPQVRVYEIGRVRTFEEVEKKWVQVDEMLMAMDSIPLVTYYTGRTGFMTAIPPLRELAFLNAKHWRMQSGIDALIDTVSVPILAISGVDEGDNVVIGAKNAVRLPQGGELKYVEHTGAAIGAASAALDALKAEMRQSGGKLLQDKSEQTKTATQSSEESARENAPLGAMVQDFEDALAQMLDVIAQWRHESTGGTITAQPNLDPPPAASMAPLITMNTMGALSTKTLFSEAKRRNLVADDLDWADEQMRIEGAA